MDYKKLTEITVKSQKELNAIPLDFKGRIYIEFGTCFQPAIVRNKYNHSVVAWDNSSVEAWENSSVVARENSSVVARGNSSVVAQGNTQVVDCLLGGKIQIAGNARIVHNPKNIHEFMDFYGISHTKTKAILYKAVHKTSDGKYYSNYNKAFIYKTGETCKLKNINTDVQNTCGEGIHISHLNWALNYGNDWGDLAILEVETKINDIVCPINTDGKVRTSEVKVLREVPLEECGLYGKIIAKRR